MASEPGDVRTRPQVAVVRRGEMSPGSSFSMMVTSSMRPERSSLPRTKIVNLSERSVNICSRISIIGRERLMSKSRLARVWLASG